ncbi:MAG TPA: ABC transporter permease, partial [Longimicrobiales bacterium]|nr:ABC transporter permease [Longimicrobiales bacterium]
MTIRALLRRPGYAGAAILTLGLGIGATVAIFAVVAAVLLRPLPYPDADDLVTVMHHAPGLDLPDLESSDGTLRFYDREADYLSAITGYRTTSMNLVGGPQPDRISVVDAGPELFDILRVPPLLGRTFTEADAAADAPAVVVLGHAFWTSRFGGDPTVVGRTVLLDGESTEIVGVMPRGFAFPDPETGAYTVRPVDPDPPFGAFGMRSLARLAPGVTLEDAAARTVEIQPRLTEYFPEIAGGFMEQAGWSVSLRTLQEEMVGDVASTLWLVLGTVAFVLLIACANVANLFLVRAESRQKELAVRAAMGAGSGSLAWGFLSEALVLAAAGGVLGL